MTQKCKGLFPSTRFRDAEAPPLTLAPAPAPAPALACTVEERKVEVSAESRPPGSADGVASSDTASSSQARADAHTGHSQRGSSPPDHQEVSEPAEQQAQDLRQRAGRC